MLHNKSSIIVEAINKRTNSGLSEYNHLALLVDNALNDKHCLISHSKGKDYYG